MAERKSKSFVGARDVYSVTREPSIVVLIGPWFRFVKGNEAVPADRRKA